MNNIFLKKTFYAIRKQYFPRWDKNNLWSVIIKGRGINQGYCDLDNKRIEINLHLANEDLEFILIHEICHAIASCYHGNNWSRRMLQAAEKAERYNNHDLALLIRKDVSCYKGEPPIRARDIYQRLEDIVMDCPKESYKNILKYLMSEHGFNNVKGFQKRYKKLQTVYNNAKNYQMSREKI